MTREYKMYVDGEWVGALDNQSYDDRNPYTGEVFARVPSGKRADAKHAVEAAVAAFPRGRIRCPLSASTGSDGAVDAFLRYESRHCKRSRG